MTAPKPSSAVLLVSLLGERGLTLATAESLTGGLIGATITAVPGASAVYLGGLIVYTTAMKARLAGLPDQVLGEYGPVSSQTAVELAVRVRSSTGADWGLSATGVAGPDPLDGHAPGEVWLGLCGPSGGSEAVCLQLAGDRATVREASVREALALVVRSIGHHPCE